MSLITIMTILQHERSYEPIVYHPWLGIYVDSI